MGLHSKVKDTILSFIDRCWVGLARKTEKNKFKDPRRVGIFSKYELSDIQKKEIDKFFLENYGTTVPYIWHRYYSSYTGQLDIQYFPELLYIPEFEHFENLWPEYCRVFADKNVLPLIAKSAGVKMPRTIISSTKGMLRDSMYRMIDKEKAIEILNGTKECFVKPSVDSTSGKGCFVWENGDSMIEFDRLGSDFTIQERIICDSSISKIYDKSVNTFRLITYRWKDTIESLPAIMRIGQGGHYLDNAHAGGVFIAINDDGVLHKTAFTEFQERFDCHPDTGVRFEGYKIHDFSKVKQAAIKMHEMMPQIGVVNWDFTIDETGLPVLIEANLSGGSIWLIEIAHGVAPFGNKTEEVLRWLRIMKSTEVSKRYKYAFGKM